MTNSNQGKEKNVFSLRVTVHLGGLSGNCSQEPEAGIEAETGTLLTNFPPLIGSQFRCYCPGITLLTVD